MSITKNEPFGDKCTDYAGRLWIREGDKWTQPDVPPFVPRVTTEQLKAYGPFTSVEVRWSVVWFYADDPAEENQLTPPRESAGTPQDAVDWVRSTYGSDVEIFRVIQIIEASREDWA